MRGLGGAVEELLLAGRPAFIDSGRMTAHPGSYPRLPRRVRDVSRLGAQHGRGWQFAPIRLKTIPVHWFDHSAIWTAKVRNVSKVGSHFKSFSFNVPPTKHASCRAAPKPGLRCGIIHPCSNLPIRALGSPPRIPPVLRERSVQNGRAGRAGAGPRPGWTEPPRRAGAQHAPSVRERRRNHREFRMELTPPAA